MSNDPGPNKTTDIEAARRLAEVRRRLAALRGRKQPEPEAAEKFSWPRDLNAEPASAGDWGRDPAEGGRE